MRSTRSIFVLKGSTKSVTTVLNAIPAYKGLTTLYTRESSFSSPLIREELNNNKSVVCMEPFNTIQENISRVFFITVLNSLTNKKKAINTNSEFIIDLGKVNEYPIIQQFETIANLLNCDIGDRYTNDSGNNTGPSVKTCNYCKFINNDYQIKNSKNINGNQIIYSNNSFIVMPTIGEICKGYLLIIPRRHCMSCAEFNQEEVLDFLQVLEDIRYILAETYGNESKLLIWENGTSSSSKGKAIDSIVHTHVHISPSNLTADDISKRLKLYFKNIKFSTEIQNYGHDNSYLLIHRKNDRWNILNNSGIYIPRQFVRQMLAEEYGVPEEWNWRTHPNYEKLQQTVSDIQMMLKTNWEKIPEHIKNNTRNFIDFDS